MGPLGPSCKSLLQDQQVGRIALSSRRDQHRIAGQYRTGGEFEPNAIGFQRNAFLDIFFPVKNDSAALKRAHQCLGNFGIQKRKEDIASVEDVDLRAERAEGAPVFSADHTGPDDRQSLGNAVQFQDRIGIVNFAVTERKKVGMNGRGTGGDEDLFTAQLDLPAGGGRIFLPIFRTQADLDRVRVEEGGRSRSVRTSMLSSAIEAQ